MKTIHEIFLKTEVDFEKCNGCQYMMTIHDVNGVGDSPTEVHCDCCNASWCERAEAEFKNQNEENSDE